VSPSETWTVMLPSPVVERPEARAESTQIDEVWAVGEIRDHIDARA